MIDIHTETLVSIKEIPKHFPGRPHTATIWRFIQRGIRGVKLETLLCGGKRFSSLEALQRFVERTTAAADGDSLPIASTPSHRRRAHEKACRELDEVGI
jgi:Protein of unknown function (DUF1580)